MRTDRRDAPKLLTDFAIFTRVQLQNRDIDPVYPVLRTLYTYPLFDTTDGDEQALQMTFLYVAYYQIASAWVHWLLGREKAPSALKLPTGVERRGMRSPDRLVLTAHLEDLERRWRPFGSRRAWLTDGFGPNPRENWQTLQTRLANVFGNGRWAAYKTGEILGVVHELPVEPTDMGMLASTGPRRGLALFYDVPTGEGVSDIATLDAQAEDLRTRLREQYGVPLSIEELETMLCNFASLVRGRYYPGHDIDEMQEQIQHVQAICARTEGGSSLRDALDWLWLARSAALPERYRGEVRGWFGIDRARQRAYRETGGIVTR